MRQRKPWDNLPDLIEDNRYSAMQLRKWIDPKAFSKMAGASRALVSAAKLAQKEMRDDLDSADRRTLEEADFLANQFEEAVVYLSGLEIV